MKLPLHLSRKSQSGLTMIELLIVITIIAILVILMMLTWRTQIVKARDAERKDDLDRLRVAFEDYYNDNNCYPPQDYLAMCDENVLSPYLNRIPCDPTTNLPYGYEYDSSCQDYGIFAILENATDPDILCTYGCGPGSNYNYYVGTAADSVAEPGGDYACDPQGECNVYSDPDADGCPVTFSSATACQNACDQSSSNWCDR